MELDKVLINLHGKVFSPVCLLSLLLLASLCQASSVSRTFSKTAAGMGENIQVNLTVSITGGESFYGIDDIYPSEWTVISTTGDTNQSGHVKFVVLQGAVNTNHSYIIRAPGATGDYNFSGIYMFENMTSYAIVSGQIQVQVTGTCANQTFYRDSDIDGYGNSSWSIQNCTAPSGYVSNSQDCNDTNPSIHPGAADTCGNGIDEDCSGSDSACAPPPQNGGGNGGGGDGGGGAAPSCVSGQTRNCSISYKGYCASGNETCINGEWKGCPQPTMELCNRIDDDCDGKADQELNCLCYDGDTRPCGSDIGDCRKGVQTCENSHWSTLCYGEVKPATEVCNGADDDCDGTVDEECKEQLSFKPCPDGEIPQTGCICEEKIYSSGLCFSNKYYEGNVIRDWTVPIIGTTFVLIFAVIIIRWRHRKLKAQVAAQGLNTFPHK